MIIQSRNVWLNEELKPAQIEFEGGIIKAILHYDEKKADEDYGEQWILPGFIDIHTHGWNKADSNKPVLKDIEAWQKHMPKEGVTSFLLTTSTQSKEDNLKAFPLLKEAIEHQKEGAEIMGINVEGNYIDMKRRGAQNQDYIVKPDAEELLYYHELSGNHILTVTCAVEHDEELEFTKKVSAQGIRVSIGHSDATFAKCKAAAEAGAKGITHCGNGMRPFHHREPGIFGAALNLDELYAEVIGDGIHVHFETAHLIGSMKGKDKLILVTDSAEQKDDPEYAKYNTIGAFRLEDGTLFGSALYVNKGVDNLHRQAHLPLVTAINAATINPARYLGFDNRKGSIDIGKDADFVICDEHIKIEQVYCKGNSQFSVTDD